ncbi:MAG: hypothetical protein Q4B70_15385 [Lachnospiraceae bacterium]|nr:hypothetical protein [Lachnospiraceae bacterium]
MFGKISLICLALVVLYENHADATSVSMLPKSILSFDMPSPHMTTTTRKSVEEVGEQELEGLYQIIGEQNYIQQIQALEIAKTKMIQAMEAVKIDIECETRGVIAQFYDSVIGANVTNSDTFWLDIKDKLTIINKPFFGTVAQQNSFVQSIMKGSGELKYALCVAVAWANKLDLAKEKLELLNKVYQNILEEVPSKAAAIALIRKNATSWKVFPGEFLTLIEEEE